jgi:hypothetical protein
MRLLRTVLELIPETVLATEDEISAEAGVEVDEVASCAKASGLDNPTIKLKLIIRTLPPETKDPLIVTPLCCQEPKIILLGNF